MWGKMDFSDANIKLYEKIYTIMEFVAQKLWDMIYFY